MNVHYCVLFSSRVMARIRVSVRFSGYAHVSVVLSDVIAPHT